jgi:predicted DNA binding CopG/RHH family protein
MEKRILTFKNEAEEHCFWLQNDSFESLDWIAAQEVVFSSLKPPIRKISIRLPESMTEELKMLANKRDVPYQFLLTSFSPRESTPKCANEQA